MEKNAEVIELNNQGEVVFDTYSEVEDWCAWFTVCFLECCDECPDWMNTADCIEQCVLNVYDVECCTDNVNIWCNKGPSSIVLPMVPIV